MTDTCYCVKGRIGLCGACLAALGESRAVSAEERFKAATDAGRLAVVREVHASCSAACDAGFLLDALAQVEAERDALRAWGQDAFRFIGRSIDFFGHRFTPALERAADRLRGEGENLALDPLSVEHGRVWDASGASSDGDET